MVRVWLRPALTALGRHAASNAKNAALKNVFAVQHLSDGQTCVRLYSSKKDKNEKKSLHAKFEDLDEDVAEVPAEVEFLSKEIERELDHNELDPELLKALEEADLELDEDDDEEEDVSDGEDVTEDEIERIKALLEGRDVDEDGFFDDDSDDEDAHLTDAEWAKKYERELSELEVGDEAEDDRLFIEMPMSDNAMSLAMEGSDFHEGEDEDDDEEEDSVDANEPNHFEAWQQGVAYSPEMLNWMAPQNQRQPFTQGKVKPWKYFVRANHPDPVELAMDVELLRLFISPTGRIRPRRFTGLTAKQQRKLAQAVKISRQLALLPYLSRYPDPSPEQWRAMEEEEIAKLLAEAENDDGKGDDDDDDDDFEELDEE